MKDEIFIYYCKCLFQVYGIPVRIFRDDKVQLKFEPVPLSPYFEPILSEYLPRQLRKTGEDFAVLQSSNMISYGYIKNRATRLSALIGPARSTEVTSEIFLEESRQRAPNHPLPERLLNALTVYFNAIPIMQLGRFTYVLSSIHAVVNEEIVTPEKMKIRRPAPTSNLKIQRDVLKHFENILNGEIERSNYYDYEKRMLLFIRNGMAQQLAAIWQDATLELTNAPNNAETLRVEKDRFILGVGIVTNAVSDCGIDKEELYRRRELYIGQAERCTNVKAVVDLRFNMMLDFCRAIEEKKRRTSDVPLVNYAISYIADNIEKKITLEDISGALHVSKSYLCTEFGKAMGIGLFSYIQEQKIERAKQFLLLTDKPLVDISELLSFSSQSYFQKVFKQVTGMTPKEFRDKERRKG